MSRIRWIFPLLALLSAACRSEDAREAERYADIPESARYGGTVVVGLATDFQSMNSLVSSTAESAAIQGYLLLMPLVRFSAELEPTPWLAESWDTVRIATDSLALTFRLRRDVFWHDGRPTMADDVRFTYEAAIDPATAYPNRSNFEQWSPTIEVLDSFTVRLRLRAHPQFMAAWQDLPILPAHVLGSVPRPELIRHSYGTVDPLGNGPFRFLRRIPGQEWVFEANPDFPEALGGRPYLDRVVFRIIPEQNTLLTELLTGRIDVYLGPTPAQARQLEAEDGVELITSPGRALTYVGWNTRLPFFDEAVERRALDLAIDRQAIVDALLYGFAEVGVSTSTPAHPGYEVQESLRRKRNLEEARALLALAGWEDREGGVLEAHDGTEFRFTMVTSQANSVLRDVGEIVQAQLRELGVDVELRAVEWNTLVSLLDGTLDANGNRIRGFEAVISGFVLGFRQDDAPLLHSRTLNEPFHETGFTNPRVDQLIDTLNVIMDPRAALASWAEYHALILDEVPLTVLYYPDRILAHRDRLQGVEMDVRGDFVSVGDWWLGPQSRR